MKLSRRTLSYISNTLLYRILKTIWSFFLIKDVLREQLKEDLCAVAVDDSNKKRILITLIETSHYQFYHLLFLAEALRLRGADVKVLVCDSTLQGCELKSIRSGLDPCFSCRFNLKNIIPIFNVDFIKLSEYVTSNDLKSIKKYAKKIINKDKLITKDSIDITTVVNDSIHRYFYGGNNTYTSKKVKAIKLDHIVSTIIGINAANQIYLRWKPDSVLSNMDAYSAWSPYKIIADKHSIKFNLISLTQFDNYKKILNMQEIFESNSRYEKWMNSRNSTSLTDRETSQLDGFLSTRFSGQSEIFKENNFFDDKIFSNQFPIDPKKTNIFLFSNIFWDVGLSQRKGLYDDVIEWVLDTVEILKDNKDICLYIKPHPGEEYSSSPSNGRVVDLIIERFDNIPKNMTIIAPNMKIKSYDLFPFIDIGLVFNGTIGLEMLINNVPIINTGMSPYSFLDSVSSPSSREEYIELLLGNKELEKPVGDEVRLFAYFYFIKTQIPWVLTSQARGGGIGNSSFSSLKEIQSGENRFLDHLCNCILDENKIIENW
jgi:hypothetical protein